MERKEALAKIREGYVDGVGYQIVYRSDHTELTLTVPESTLHRAQECEAEMIKGSDITGLD